MPKRIAVESVIVSRATGNQVYNERSKKDVDEWVTIQAPIGVVVDGTYGRGEAFDFTDDEIAYLKVHRPQAIRYPVPETVAVDDEAEKAAKAAKAETEALEAAEAAEKAAKAAAEAEKAEKGAGGAKGGKGSGEGAPNGGSESDL